MQRHRGAAFLLGGIGRILFQLADFLAADAEVTLDSVSVGVFHLNLLAAHHETLAFLGLGVLDAVAGCRNRSKFVLGVDRCLDVVSGTGCCDSLQASDNVGEGGVPVDGDFVCRVAATVVDIS